MAPLLLLLLLFSQAAAAVSTCSSSCSSSSGSSGSGSGSGSGSSGTTTIPAQHGRPNSKPLPPPVRALVQSTCNSTTYYDLCVASITADPSSSTADLRGLCAIAVSAAAANASAVANATSTASAAAATSRSSTSTALLLRMCAGKYVESRDALVAARESIVEEDYEYAFVHVSAAAEYPSVCRALFRRKQEAYPLELARREAGLEHLCTIAIDIISILASS